jgi:hypothetical protein
MSHKNDPDYHDIKAKILLETATHHKTLVKNNSKGNLCHGDQPGLLEAAAELRRMASNARRAHKKVQDDRRQKSRKESLDKRENTLSKYRNKEAVALDIDTTVFGDILPSCDEEESSRDLRTLKRLWNNIPRLNRN